MTNHSETIILARRTRALVERQRESEYEYEFGERGERGEDYCRRHRRATESKSGRASARRWGRKGKKTWSTLVSASRGCERDEFCIKIRFTSLLHACSHEYTRIPEHNIYVHTYTRARITRKHSIIHRYTHIQRKRKRRDGYNAT